MNNIFRIFSCLTLLALLLPSCSKEDPFTDGEGKGEGTANFRKMVVEVNSSENQVRAAEVNIGDFLVEVKSTAGAGVYSCIAMLDYFLISFYLCKDNEMV